MWPYILIGLALGGCLYLIGTYIYAYMATHPPRLKVRHSPADEGLAYEDVTFRARDGLRLNGWLIPANEANALNGVIIVCHGYPMNRAEMLPHAKMLHAAGYTTLLFDFRAMGESEGHISSAGHFEVDDLHGALDYLQTRQETAIVPFGVLGHSLGAAVAIMTAARDERLVAVVAESPYPSLDDALEARFRYSVGPLARILAKTIEWWARRWLDFAPQEVAPRQDIAHIGPRAVMIIQGQRDLLVRWQDAVAMYHMAQEPRELWLLERSRHARCLRDQPDEYARRVKSFFQTYLVQPF